MRLLICGILFFYQTAVAGTAPRVETQSMFGNGPRQYTHSVSIDLDNTISMQLVSTVDFARFVTDNRQKLFDITYSNPLSTNKFGKSATVYLGERALNPLPDSPREKHYMHITQLKEAVVNEAQAKDVLAKKTSYKNQPVQFKTNKNGLKMAVANYAHKSGQYYYYIVIMGIPSYVINETYMVNPDSIAIAK